MVFSIQHDTNLSDRRFAVRTVELQTAAYPFSAPLSARLIAPKQRTQPGVVLAFFRTLARLFGVSYERYNKNMQAPSVGKEGLWA